MTKQTLAKLIMKGRKSPLPADIEVMLANKVEEPFNREGWIYEIKFDGYRVKARKDKHAVKLISRSSLDYTDTYSEVTEALKKIQHDVFLDGEITVLNEKLHPDFTAIKKYRKGDPIRYYVLTYCGSMVITFANFHLQKEEPY